jgi:GT2 family glycosyltransferase
MELLEDVPAAAPDRAARGTSTAVIVVSWHSAGHLPAALASVPGGVECVVVDNASEDGSAGLAERAGARVVRMPGNAGFGPACNAGAAAAAGADALFFLNPDAELLDGANGLAAPRRALAEDPSVGAVAPALVGHGQELFQLRKLPTLGSLAREAFLVNRLLPGNAALRAERYLDRRRDEPFDVEQPAAAALLVRRIAFDAIGGFDPAFAPAWFEDVDLCARLREAGWRIRFVPGARAGHSGGSSRERLLYRDFLPLYTRNLLRYLARHESLFTRAAARAVVAAGAALRLGLLPFVRGEHERGDAARAFARVLTGCLGLGWKSALLEKD